MSTESAKPTPLNLDSLTLTQLRVLRSCIKAGNGGGRQIAGNGQAPYLQSARSLVRKGILNEWRTSRFSVNDSVLDNRDELLPKITDRIKALSPPPPQSTP